MKRSFLLVLMVIFLLVMVFSASKYLSDTLLAIILLIINLISIITAFLIMFGKKRIESKIAWTIAVLFVPVVGFLLFIILGVEYNRFKKFDDKLLLEDDIDKVLNKNKDKIETIINKLKGKRDIINLIYNVGKFPVTLNSKTEILTNGDVKFKRLIEELKKATSFIHVEYFIINEGKILDEILKILYQKTKEGVEVKILYDDLGSVDLSKKVIKEMNENNIKTAVFNEINFKLFRPSVNYRNHRKIVVIDNKVGFTGGINIGDEYAHLNDYYGFWRDTHILIEGSAVCDLNMIFIKDWYHTTNETLNSPKYLERNLVKNDKSAVQIVADGPDNSTSLIRDTFFKMINEAEERIWITTPYLILDSQLINSLKVAALSGKDVRIIVPGLHDRGKKIIYKATEAYFSELLEVGVKIYKYDDHFIHSKIIITDNDIASIGTVNLDYRSLDLHFEDTVMLYLDKSIDKLIKDFEEDLLKSTEVKWETWKNRHFIQKSVESFIRIFSPLL